ncbi:uncharacterized protein [Maniola hyperantus]|uniref:uncharacterized protein n=1 Tax=Aphantopus hyperantus TaxID=2795564 RepID=UPI00374A78BD
MGYVMSEILERYRQMVGLAQREEKFKMDSLFETIKHTELIQKLFFEIFHLVNMFHEISKKYSHAPSEEDQIKKILERQKEIDSIRKIEKKKRMKQLKKDREMFKKQGKVMDKKDRKPGNRWWPIDYGWEVDYQWW